MCKVGAQGNVLFQCYRSRGRHRQPKLSVQRRCLFSFGLFSTCSLCFTAPKDGVREHTVWFPLGSLPSAAVDSNTEQKTEQCRRLTCVAGAELLPVQYTEILSRTVLAGLVLTSKDEPQLLTLHYSSSASPSHSCITQKFPYDYMQFKSCFGFILLSLN